MLISKFEAPFWKIMFLAHYFSTLKHLQYILSRCIKGTILKDQITVQTFNFLIISGICLYIENINLLLLNQYTNTNIIFAKLWFSPFNLSNNWWKKSLHHLKNIKNIFFMIHPKLSQIIQIICSALESVTSKSDFLTHALLINRSWTILSVHNLFISIYFLFFIIDL